METGESGELRGGDITACSDQGMAGTLHETLKPITSRRGAISLDYPTLGETGGAIGPSPQLSSSPAQLNIGGSSVCITELEPPKQGVCGLKNLGNTCYMNSGLQCLLHEPSCFMRLSDPNFLNKEKGTKGISTKSLTHEFRSLLLDYWNGQSREIAPEKFKTRLGQTYDQFEGYFQHDGQEFLALLLDKLHVEWIESQKVAVESENGPNYDPNSPNTSTEILSRAVSSDDSAFLSAGSSTESTVDSNVQISKSTPEPREVVSPMSDIGTEMNRSRKRQSSGSSQNSEQNPASPDSSGSVNYAFNQLNVSIPNDKIDDKSPTQPAKRPRLTSECTLESDNPDELWKKYMAENTSLVSQTFQGQFASELTCNVCKHRFTKFINRKNIDRKI